MSVIGENHLNYFMYKIMCSYREMNIDYREIVDFTVI